MPVPANFPSGKALYDDAFSLFVHNMPLETLQVVHTAMQSGAAYSSKQLASQFLVLQLTTFGTIYRANNPSEYEGKYLRSRSSSKATVSSRIPQEWKDILLLPPRQFLHRLWYMSLQYYQDHRIRPFPSLECSVGLSNDTDISSNRDNLLSALQLPAATVEALILASLKVDEDLNRRKGSPHAVEKAKIKGNLNSSPGLVAARAMCEWLLAAFSAVELDEIAPSASWERTHLRLLYERVIRLYTLDVLGQNLEEWEYAREMVRCSKAIVPADSVETKSRNDLLRAIDEAEHERSLKQERHIAAKERARRMIEEQVAKRAASVEYVTAQNGTNVITKEEAKSPESTPSRTSVSPSPPSPTPPSPTTETSARLPTPVKHEKDPLSETSSRHSTSRDDQYEKHEGPGRSLQDQSSAPTGQNSDLPHHRTITRSRGSDAPASSTAALVFSFKAWVRSLGTGPILASILAVLLIARRFVSLTSRSGGSSQAIPRQLSNARYERQSLGQRNNGIASFLWQKLADTVRM